MFIIYKPRILILRLKYAHAGVAGVKSLQESSYLIEYGQTCKTSIAD